MPSRMKRKDRARSRLRRRRTLAALAAAVIGTTALAGAADASIVSIHFYYSTAAVDSNGSAGTGDARVQGFWNNDDVSNTTIATGMTSLATSASTPTSIDVVTTYTGDGQGTTNAISKWNSSPTTEDQQLYEGDIYGSVASAPKAIFTNIPYSSYEVYVYMGGASGGNYQISDGEGHSYWYAGDNSAGVQQTLTNYTPAQASSTSSSATAANYAEFNETTNSFTISFPTAPSNATLYGVQIVSTPEPATVGMVGSGVATLLLRRRRNFRR
jgi:hypothetical protein